MHSMRRVCLRIYNFCVAIPDHLYPFSEEIEGQTVRWKAAYDQAIARRAEQFGFGHYGARLIAYRSVFHVIGSLLFILFATLVSRDLFGSEAALYVLFVLAALALVYQEFFVQPRTFGQMRLHSVFDVLSWIVPFCVYLYIHLH